MRFSLESIVISVGQPSPLRGWSSPMHRSAHLYYRFCHPKSCPGRAIFFRMQRINGHSDGLTPAFACSARLGATCRSQCTRCHSRDTGWRKRDTSWRTRDTSCHFLSSSPESVAEVTESDRLCLTRDNQRQFVTRYRRARWSFVKQNYKRCARTLRRSLLRACSTCSTPSAYSHARSRIRARQASSEIYYLWVGGSSAFHRSARRR